MYNVAALSFALMRRCFAEAGCHKYEVVDQVGPASSSAAIGDVADEIQATLLVMSTEVRFLVEICEDLSIQFFGFA